MDRTGFTIGQLARAAGVPTSTVRFYERNGLMKPDARSGANYRQYGPGSLERLRFIRSAQATGFSLQDIAGLLTLTHADGPPCEDVIALTERRLGEVRGRIKELRRVERVLAHSLETCCKGNGPDLCDAITRLASGACKPGRGSGKSASPS